MKHFNKLRDQLRNENSHLPSEFSWEEMGQGILEKVNAKDKGDKQKLSKYRTTIYVLTGIILALSILSLKYYNQSKNTATDVHVAKNIAVENKYAEVKINQEITSESVQSHVDAKDGAISQNLATNLISKNNVEELKKGEQKQNSTSPLASNHSPIQKVSSENQAMGRNSSIIDEIIPINQKYSNDINRLELQKPNRSMEEQSLDKTDITIAPNSNPNTPLYLFADSKRNASIISDANIANQVNESKNNNSIEISNLPILDQYCKYPINTFSLESNLELLNVNPTFIKKWSAAFGLGINRWNIGVSNLDTSNIYTHTTTDYGQNYFFHLGYKLNDHYSFQSGLGYQKLVNKLDHTTTAFKERKVNDVVLYYTINPITGNTTEQRGDTVVIDTHFRKVVHYNTYIMVQIPLSIQYERKVGKWAYGVGLGCTIQMLNSYEGKYATNTDFVAYTTSDDLYKKYNMSLQGNLFAKDIYSNLYIGSSLWYTKSLGSWSKPSENDLKPSVFNGNLFIGLDF